MYVHICRVQFCVCLYSKSVGWRWKFHTCENVSEATCGIEPFMSLRNSQVCWDVVLEQQKKRKDVSFCVHNFFIITFFYLLANSILVVIIAMLVFGCFRLQIPNIIIYFKPISFPSTFFWLGVERKIFEGGKKSYF